MARQTKGSIEADVANAVVRMHRDQQGRGPKDVKAQLIGDVIVVRCSGIFTQTEDKLSTTEEGRNLINSSRRELRAITRAEADGEIAKAVGAQLLRSYYDLIVAHAEEVHVFVFEEDLEKKLLRAELQAFSTATPRRL